MLVAPSRRRSNGALSIPTLLDAPTQRLSTDATTRIAAPIFDKLSFTKGSQPYIDPTIVRLLTFRYPRGVLRLIVSIIVDSFNRQCVGVAIRQSPFFKRWIALTSRPFFAHTNSATTIVFKPFVVRIAATISHVLPNIVKPLNFAAYARAMFNIRFALSLLRETATGLARSIVQRVDLHGNQVPAFAATNPTLAVLSSLDRSEATKDLVRCHSFNDISSHAPNFSQLGMESQ